MAKKTAKDGGKKAGKLKDLAPRARQGQSVVGGNARLVRASVGRTGTISAERSLR